MGIMNSSSSSSLFSTYEDSLHPRGLHREILSIESVTMVCPGGVLKGCEPNSGTVCMNGPQQQTHNPVLTEHPQCYASRNMAECLLQVHKTGLAMTP